MVQAEEKLNTNRRKSMEEVFRDYKERISVEKKHILKEVKIKKSIEKTSEELKDEIETFLRDEIIGLQENGELCLDMCEDEGSFHMVSYWLNDTYLSVNEFIEEYYSEKLGNIILDMYPNTLSVLEEKVKNKYGSYTKKQLVYEALASILLSKMQYYPQWYTVYGSEENDMLDFSKYHISNAYYDNEDFPIMKKEDIVAAMYGVNDTIQPSDLYDVFAHYADKLKFEEENSLFTKKEEPIFTPDAFLVAGVVARWKNYVELENKLKKGCVSTEVAMIFNNLMDIKDNNIRISALVNYVISDYFNRFNSVPNSIPLNKNMVIADYNMEYINIKYKIRGIKNKEVCWEDIYQKKYDIPATPSDLQSLIFTIATDFKRELCGIEKERGSTVGAYEGKYPNKYSASHGLNFVKDLNIKVKNKRGIEEKKPSKPNYTLALAEKQSLYFIKKMLRYAKNNPIVATSFGIDSTITQHLVKRVAKHSYSLVHNNSLVEYGDVLKFKNNLLGLWEMKDRIYETVPNKTFWEVQKLQGWNFARKGSRTVNSNGKKSSPSEVCCSEIKHKPMHKLTEKLILENNPIEVNFSGLRAAESLARFKQGKRDNVVYYAKSWKCIRVNPILFFTDDMVWEYQKKYNIPYCSVYDKLLYYEDVFDNISEEEYGKVLYKPRVGCWCCAVTTGHYYWQWLKKFYPKQYQFIMIKKGMAKDIFINGAKKLGVIPADFEIAREKDNEQISFFDSEDNKKKQGIKDVNSVFGNYSLEDMERLISRRPCKFN